VAIFHLSLKAISRSTGRSATAAAAYRAGCEIVDERTGEIHDYRRRRGVEAGGLVAPHDAPAWAFDRAALWNAVEAAEKRKNSTVAREIVLALPAELDAAARQQLARDFAHHLVERFGVAVDVAIHAPGEDGDDRNHHAHVLFSTRRLGPDGFGPKTRELDDRVTGPAITTQLREHWAGQVNAALAKAGQAARVDHRSLADQGIARAPGAHLGPAATEFERRTGQRSRIRRDAERRVPPSPFAPPQPSAQERGALARREQAAVDQVVRDCTGRARADAEHDKERAREAAELDRQIRERQAAAPSAMRRLFWRLFRPAKLSAWVYEGQVLAHERKQLPGAPRAVWEDAQKRLQLADLEAAMIRVQGAAHPLVRQQLAAIEAAEQEQRKRRLTPAPAPEQPRPEPPAPDLNQARRRPGPRP